MNKQIQIFHEGKPWECLRIQTKWETWEIGQCTDSDIEITCEGTDGITTLFLSQDELKEVVAFLQSKVKLKGGEQ
jgi:hypothetical protein